MIQVHNPLNFGCLPNEATPEYVAYHNFRPWLAYGMMTCWLSNDSEDPNVDCHMVRPVTRDDVLELRDVFLDIVETVIVSLWKGQHEPGDGDVDGDWRSVTIGYENSSEEETNLAWHVRLDRDAAMFSLGGWGGGWGGSIDIWLKYGAFNDRRNVLAVLTEARQTLGSGPQGQVWPTLIELVRPSLVKWKPVEAKPARPEPGVRFLDL